MHSKKQHSPMTVTEAGRGIVVRPLSQNARASSRDNSEPLSNAAHETDSHFMKKCLLITSIEDDIH
jgi:hypothetical protein